MKEFVYLLQDLFQWTFQILPALGNIPNYLFAVVLFVMTVYWLKTSASYSAEAEKNRTLE